MSSNEDSNRTTVQTPSNNASNDISFSPEYLIKRWEMGFSSILPSEPDGRFVDTKLLITQSMEERFKSEYPNYSFCRFFYHVADYWTSERLTAWAPKFKGVRVVGGKTYVRKDGKKLGPFRLFQLDIDSKGAYNLLKPLLESRLVKFTFVVKSRKEYGYHVYWLEDWNDNQGDCTTIRADDCKTDYEFELFCGFQTTQLAGAHPKVPISDFRYVEVGCTDLKEPGLLIHNGLYDEIMVLLKDCLTDPDDIRKRRKDQKKYNYTYHSGEENTDNDMCLAIYDSNRPTIKLSDLDVTIAVEWASRFYGAEGEDHNQHYNFFSMAFIDSLIRRYVDEESIYKIMDQLFDRKPHAKYTKTYWHKFVVTGFYRLQTGQDLYGIPSLKKQIQKDPDFVSDTAATAHTDELLSKLGIDDESISQLVAGVKGNNSNQGQGNLVQKDLQQRQQEHQQRKAAMDTLLTELEKSIPDKQFIEYAIKSIQKVVKRDTPLIKQVLYTGLSAYSDDPLNLTVISQSSEGKTHTVMTVINEFPQEDIIKIGTMTPKVLIRDRGIHVDNNNNPLRDRIFQLEKQLKIAKGKKTKNYELIEKLENELGEVYNNSRYCIDFRNKILVFLETPHEDIIRIMKPIMSHDSFEIEHPYVFSVDNQGFSVKKIVTIGWPAFIFCTAKDESGWEEWPEIESRCIVTSPSMVKQKYADAIGLSSQNKTLPKTLQKKVIRSDSQLELTKKCIQYTKLSIQDITSYNISLWSPFSQILSEVMQAREGRDMRVANKIFNLLNISTLTRAHQRRTIHLFNNATNNIVADNFIDNNNSNSSIETSIVTDIEDLKEVYSISKNTTGMQFRKFKEFSEVFYPLFNEKSDSNNTIVDGKDEGIIAVSVNEICDYHKEKLKTSLGKDALRKFYISDWKRAGLIDEEYSTINPKKKIYTLLSEPSYVFSASNIDAESCRVDADPHLFSKENEKNTSDTKKMDTEVTVFTSFSLKIPPECPKIPENWLKYELQIIEELVGPIKVFDIDKSEINVLTFTQKYEKNKGDIWGVQDKRSSNNDGKIGISINPHQFFDSENIQQRGRAYDRVLYLNMLEREEQEKLGVFGNDIERNSLIDAYLNRRFVKEDLSEVETIVEMLLGRPFIEKVSNNPLRLRWKSQAQTQTQQQVYPTQSQPRTQVQQIQVQQVKPQIQIQELAKLQIQDQANPQVLQETKPQIGLQAQAHVKEPLQRQQQLQDSNDKSFNESELFKKLSQSAAYDCEWAPSKDATLHCVCVVPSNGAPIRLHIDQPEFAGDKTKFIIKVVDTLLNYELIFGHNILGENSDFHYISRMYLEYGIGDRNERLKELAIIKTRSIDTLKVFKQKIIESALKYDNIDYPSHKLDDIAKACIGEGKLEDLTGPEVINLSIDKQLDYCAKDAELVLKIVQRDNWIVFQMIDAMTLPVNMKFIDICNAEFPTKIGENILQFNGYSNDMVPSEYKTKKINYAGGEVMQPTAGVYQNVVCVDCKSQYPNIIKELNLSSETINTPCCANDQSKRIPDHIMNELNDGLIAKGEQPREPFCICTHKGEGIFGRIERQLFELKSHYENIGETVKAKTIKLLANSLYGMFQNLAYRYVDQRLGFIITAAGRVIVKGLATKCGKYNMKAIYGDTDSTFLRLYDNSDLDGFIKDSEEEYGAPLAIDKEWYILLFTKNKKGYFGITKQGKFVYKKIHGMKSNSTPLQMLLMSGLVRRETLESFVKDKSETQSAILEDIRHIFTELEDRINSNDIDYIRTKLAFAFTAEKSLDQYEGSGYQHEIYLERIAESKSIEEDSRYHYYKITPVEVIDSTTGESRLKKFTTRPENYQLNIWKYKESLFNCIKEILSALEFDTVSLGNELVGNEPGKGKRLKCKSSDD